LAKQADKAGSDVCVARCVLNFSQRMRHSHLRTRMTRPRSKTRRNFIAGAGLVGGVGVGVTMMGPDVQKIRGVVVVGEKREGGREREREHLVRSVDLLNLPLT